MTVRVYGMLAEITGSAALNYFEMNSIDELKSKLFSEFPALTEKKFSIAVNRKIVTGNPALNNSDDIALLPPFSGG